MRTQGGDAVHKLRREASENNTATCPPHLNFLHCEWGDNVTTSRGYGECEFRDGRSPAQAGTRALHTCRSYCYHTAHFSLHPLVAQIPAGAPP